MRQLGGRGKFKWGNSSWDPCMADLHARDCKKSWLAFWMQQHISKSTLFTTTMRQRCGEVLEATRQHHEPDVAPQR